MFQFRFARISASVLLALIFLAPRPAFAAEACTPTPEEESIWRGIQGSSDPRLYLSYLRQFPQGCYRPVAIFYINSLVPAKVDLRVDGAFSDNRRFQVEGETWIDAGLSGAGPNWVNQFRVIQVSEDPLKVKVLVQCESVGIGRSGWVEGPCHPGGSSFLQGLSARLTGTWADFYDINIDCLTKVGFGGDQRQLVRNGEWCGASSAAPGRHVNGMALSVLRKQFQ